MRLFPAATPPLSSRWLRACAAIGGLAALVGCHNPCQDLCKEIAAYAEDCGYTLPEDEPQTCIQNNKRSEWEREDLDTCRESADRLEEEWSCDDVGRYFQNEGQGG